jgi:hypothetical protein
MPRESPDWADKIEVSCSTESMHWVNHLSNAPFRHHTYLPVASLAITLAVLALSACTSTPIHQSNGTTSGSSFHLTNLAKSDIDTVAEISEKQVIASLRLLTEKLYRRNPVEWHKGSCIGLEQAVNQIFDPLNHWYLSNRMTLDWKASIFQAFKPEYQGDRIRSLMEGLLAMTMTAYDNKTQFYLFESLDPQKLYNTARNFEVVAWKLSNAKNEKGQAMLLTNSMEPGATNLSFEREFGKIIATQDNIARIVEDKTNRSIRTSVFNAASFILLPI